MSKIHVQNPNTAEDSVAAKYDRFRRKAKNFAAYVRWWIHEYIMYQMYSSSFDSDEIFGGKGLNIALLT